MCAGWSEPLVVAHTCTTLLEISCHGSNVFEVQDTIIALLILVVLSLDLSFLNTAGPDQLASNSAS